MINAHNEAHGEKLEEEDKEFNKVHGSVGKRGGVNYILFCETALEWYRLFRNVLKSFLWLSFLGLSKDEVVAQSILFFLAGYDTTATSISFLMYNLALYPEIQEKLYEEIMNVAGDKVILYLRMKYQSKHFLIYLNIFRYVLYPLD